MYLIISPPSLQAARLPRLLRTHHTINNFFFKIVGDGTKLLVIILLTGIFLMFFAVINMQLFGYIEPSNECKAIGDGHFDNFFLVICTKFMRQNFFIEDVMTNMLTYGERGLKFEYLFDYALYV